jgi:hypothetical protein
MRRIITPEEMAALFEELREAEGEPVSLHRGSPEEILSRGRGFPEPNRNGNSQDLSNWLMALAGLYWPHL